MVGRSKRYTRDRGFVRAFDLTSDKRNDIYFASVTALFVISDKRRFYIYIYIRWDLVRGDPVRLDVVALIGRGLLLWEKRRGRRRNWCRGRADSRIPPR